MYEHVDPSRSRDAVPDRDDPRQVSGAPPGSLATALSDERIERALGDEDPSREGFRHQDLSGHDFSGQSLVGADFTGAQLFGANFTGANLHEATLADCELSGANFTKASLEGVNASRAGFGNAKLNGANLLNGDFADATFTNASLCEGDLRGANFTGARLRKADLSRTDCSRACFRGTDLTDCLLVGACFQEVNFRDAKLQGVAGYRSATFLGSDIRDVNFAGAYLLRRYIMDEDYLHEFRRQSPLHGFIWKLWWFSSDCGRSFSRWGAITAIITAMFGFFYRFVSIDYGDYETALSPYYYSLVTLTTLGFGDVLPASLPAQLVTMSEVAIGYLLLGGLISIMATKMARRAE